MSTLTNIRTKVRRITRSPADAQITDTQIDSYVNTFILYDMPQMDTIFNLRRTITFYTNPYVGEYGTTINDTTDPLYNFKNRYTNIMPPAFVGGRMVLFYQSRTDFYSLFLLANYMEQLGTGDGVTTHYAGTLSNKPLIQKNVTISAQYIDVDGNVVKLAMHDVPETFNDAILTTGHFYEPNDLTTPLGDINYVTGTYTVDFPIAPAIGSTIYLEAIPYAAGYPSAILFYEDKFYIRPIPDRVYPITLDARVLPTELINDGDHPDIDQWWQFIALGASKKIFEDRMDMDSIQLIMPEMQNQEALCMRKTIMQMSSQRSSTIYTQPFKYPNGFWFGSDYGIF